MAKTVLEKFDADQEAAVKSDVPEAVVEEHKAEDVADEAVNDEVSAEEEKAEPAEEPAEKEAEVDAPVEEAKAEPEAAPVSVPEETKVEEAPVEEAKKDGDENSDAAPSPKPFEHDDKVTQSHDDANGGKPEDIHGLTETFVNKLAGVEKALADNQASVADVHETINSLADQISEVKALLADFVTKSANTEAVAEKAADEAEPAKKDGKAEEAKKSDKAHKDDDSDCDDPDCDDDYAKGEGKKDMHEHDDNKAEKSVAEDDVAEPVDDEPLYVAEKSAAIGSPVAEVAPEKEPEEAEKSINEQYAVATRNVGAFNDKLVAEAQHGIITREQWAEKSMLSDDIAYGRDITAEKLAEFNSYISK